MKFKVGDKVQIVLSDDRYAAQYPKGFVHTVLKLDGLMYRLDIAPNTQLWGAQYINCDEKYLRHVRSPLKQFLANIAADLN